MACQQQKPNTSGPPRAQGTNSGAQEEDMDTDNAGSGDNVNPAQHEHTHNPQNSGDGNNTRLRQHHSNPCKPHMESRHDESSVQQTHQMTTQKQAFRSKQEEFEKREHDKERNKRSQPLPKSHIVIPDQSHKTDQDVQAIVETQLLLFQTHLHRACRSEVRDEVIHELEEAIKRWIAVRDENGYKHSKTDEYAAQIFEIITRGKTQHPAVFHNQPDIGEQDLQQAAQHYFAGDAQRAQLDREFHQNPSKKASMPAVRGDGSSSESGLRRIYERRPDLVENPDNLM